MDPQVMLPVLALLRAEVGFSGGELWKDGVHMVCLGWEPHKVTDKPHPQGVPHQGVRERLELLEGLRHEVRALSLPGLLRSARSSGKTGGPGAGEQAGHRVLSWPHSRSIVETRAQVPEPALLRT